MRRLTIARALDDYVAERAGAVIAAERLTVAAKRLKAALGSVPAGDRKALAAAVARYVARRSKDKAAPGTVARDLVVLRAAVRHAWKAGRLDAPPYIAMPAAGRSRQRWLTQTEAKALLKHCESGVYLFALIALTTGARLSAILELTRDRVDLQQRTIDFRSPHPKAHRRKHRAVVPIAEPLYRELLRERKAQRRHHLHARKGYVVPFGEGRQARRLLRVAATEAGLEGVTPHVLRHTAATWMLGEGGVPLIIASAMLGHRSTLITEQIYAHLTAHHLTDAANLLGDMVR